jgi:hypothetical protein
MHHNGLVRLKSGSYGCNLGILKFSTKLKSESDRELLVALLLQQKLGIQQYLLRLQMLFSPLPVRITTRVCLSFATASKTGVILQ